MKKNKIIIDKTGLLNRDSIDTLLQKVKSVLDDLEPGQIIIKNVYSAAVESLDNVFKHSDYREANDELTKKYPPHFIFETAGNTITINVRNLVLSKNINDLKVQLDKINSLKAGKLNQLYKSTLRNAQISDKGGAGLGLIIIAKVSGQRIKYDFEKINEKFSYFALQIKFNNINQ